jgi:type III secretory pathway component EscV
VASGVSVTAKYAAAFPPPFFLLPQTLSALAPAVLCVNEGKKSSGRRRREGKIHKKESAKLQNEEANKQKKVRHVAPLFLFLHRSLSERRNKTSIAAVTRLRVFTETRPDHWRFSLAVQRRLPPAGTTLHRARSCKARWRGSAHQRTG